MTEKLDELEAELKSDAMSELLQQCPAFLILEYLTVGAPDREVVGCGITSRWEFKRAAPAVKSRGIQKLMMLRLAAAGHARYVVWEERKAVQRTLIVHPRHIGNLMPESWCAGFDHKWLVGQIRKVHGL